MNHVPPFSTKATVAPPAPTSAELLLEREQPFSKSMLWGLGRGFYEQTGLSAWTSGVVPYYITSNPYIAHVYAQLVLAYLGDCVAAGGGLVERREPIYIVELAAGHGKFSFFFLQELCELKPASPLRDLEIRYIMADFAEANLLAWDTQPLFDPFREAGILDSARFDLENPGELHLRRAGITLRKGDLRNPLIVFGNYIFDTVVHDLFRVENRQLLQGLVSLRCPAGAPANLGSPETLSRLQTDFSYAPLADKPYYGDGDLDALLDEYREVLADTDFLIPIATITCLRKIGELCGDRLLVISSDKGFSHLDEMFFQRGGHVQYHGSFSCMVNFHALGRLFSRRGGTALLSKKRHVSLKTTAFVLGLPAAQLHATRYAFGEYVDRLGPCDYYRLVSGSSSDKGSFEQILGLLYLSRYDPDIFCQQSSAILEHVATLSEPLRDELLSIMERLRVRHYPIGYDLPFELSRVYLALQRPREALRCCQESLRIYGDHAITFCHAGICHFCNEEPAEAVRCLQRAVEIEPGHALARAWLARLSESGHRFTPTGR